MINHVDHLSDMNVVCLEEFGVEEKEDDDKRELLDSSGSLVGGFGVDGVDCELAVDFFLLISEESLPLSLSQPLYRELLESNRYSLHDDSSLS